MKTILDLLGFAISSGICSVFGRAIGKLIIWLFPKINIAYNTPYTEVFLNSVFYGLGAGTCWILYAGPLFRFKLRSEPLESIKTHVARIYVIYVTAFLVIGIWPP